MEDLCSAARQYAASVGIDDATFVRAFLTALNAGVDLRCARPTAFTDVGGATRPIPSVTLLTSSIYAAHARQLYASKTGNYVGGWATRPAEHRECVLVRNRAGLCAGVLVARNVVVTAAHCSCDGCETSVTVGAMTVGSELSVRVARVVVHPAFDTASHANDIAVLMLEDDVDGIARARIAAPGLIDAATDVRVIGFDQAFTTTFPAGRVKRAVHVPVASSTCRSADDQHTYRCHAGADLVIGKPALWREDVGWISGSPCYVRSGNRWQLAGITSRPIPGNHLQFGDGVICVRIDRYAPWIRSVPGGKW